MEEWAGLSPLHKLTVFKLLAPEAALAFFKTLGFDDRYLLFCGFEHGSIAPVTSELPPARRAVFEKLGPDAYSEMLRSLSTAEESGGRQAEESGGRQ